MADDPVIERHLAALGTALRVRGAYRDRVLAELRAHLEDARDTGVARGLTRREASERAIDQLGSPHDLVARVRPHATRFTRMTAGAAAVGVVLAVGSARAANVLHADDARLGSSIPYTAVWAVGWLSILLLAGPVVALFVRHRGSLGRSGAAAAGAACATAVAMLCFHFSNDGSLNRGPGPDVWRNVSIILAALATIALGTMIRRTRLVARWPMIFTSSGLALVAAHYSVLNAHGATALAGLALLAFGGASYAALLMRERPLA